MLMKQHILAALQEEYRQWEDLLAGLSEEQIIAAHADEGWSIKDVIAHLWAWQQRSIARMQAAIDGNEPQFPPWPDSFDPETHGEPDQLNAWIDETNRDRSWSDVSGDWRAGFVRFLEQGARVSEQDLLDSTRYAWLEGLPLACVLLASYDHHQEHFDSTRAWLRSDAD